MNSNIRRIFAVGLGAAAIVLCTPAQTVFAATEETQTVQSEENAGLMAKTADSLAAPTLTVETVGYDSVTVAWEAVDSAQTYELQQSENKKDYTTIATLVQGQELHYTASGLYTAKNYYYRVIVTAADGTSVTSKVLKAKTVLFAPDVITLELSADNQVSITWTAVEGADSYRVYRSASETGGYKRLNTVNDLFATDTVAVGETCYYKIRPVRINPNGKAVLGDRSTPQSITGSIVAPANLKVSNSSGNSLMITWDSVPEVDGYVVRRRAAGETTYKRVAMLKADSTGWQDKTVEAGTKYYYKIRAYKTISGKRTYGRLSAAKSKWTVSVAPDDIVTTQDGNGTVFLTWSPSKAATSYRLYRAVGTNGEYTRIATGITECSYTDSALALGETYSYCIEAVHGSLVSEKSSASEVKIGNIKVNTRTLFLGPEVSASLSAVSDQSGTIGWRSADPAIAVVGEDGTVTGVAPGKTQIIAFLDGIEASVDVTVTDCQLNGIDVSKWQQGINWETVKASGIKFAMLRLAHGTSKDILFEDYYAGAMEQGIPVGIYCYTLAKSVDEGIAEANKLLELLDGKALDYPIALDLESENQIKNMNKAARTELILEYKRIIEEAGYQFVLYANLNWLNNYIDQTKLAEENVDIWIARYCDQSLGHRYEGGGNVRMWQYSSSGYVDGILDAYGKYIKVDLDVCYDGY